MRFRVVHVAGGAALAAFLLPACSGSGGGAPPTPPAATPAPVLVPNTVRRFAGTETVTRTYASPGPTTPNFTALYTISEATTVNAAAPGSPAAFDLHTVATYTATQKPLAGEATSTVTTDTYQRQSVSGNSVVVQTAGTKTVTVGDDVSADYNGGGPYTETVSVLALYPTPQLVGTYPLVTGTSYAQPIAHTASNTSTIVNAGGANPPLTVFPAAETQTYNADGTYAFTFNLSNGDTQQLAQAADGTALLNETGPVQTLQEVIAAPTNPGTGFIIPVTVVRQTVAHPTPVTQIFSAADWYPGAGQPSLPFDATNVTVKGPVTSLPSGCAGAGSFPNTVEVDQTSSSLSLLGSLVLTRLQRFDSYGLPVCRLTTTTTTDYNIETGLQTSQTVAQTNVVLQSVGASAAAQATTPARHI